jgi:hypothetical protein
VTTSTLLFLKKKKSLNEVLFFAFENKISIGPGLYGNYLENLMRNNELRNVKMILKLAVDQSIPISPKTNSKLFSYLVNSGESQFLLEIIKNEQFIINQYNANVILKRLLLGKFKLSNILEFLEVLNKKTILTIDHYNTFLRYLIKMDYEEKVINSVLDLMKKQKIHNFTTLNILIMNMAGARSKTYFQNIMSIFHESFVYEENYKYFLKFIKSDLKKFNDTKSLVILNNILAVNQKAHINFFNLHLSYYSSKEKIESFIKIIKEMERCQSVLNERTFNIIIPFLLKYPKYENILLKYTHLMMENKFQIVEKSEKYQFIYYLIEKNLIKESILEINSFLEKFMNFEKDQLLILNNLLSKKDIGVVHQNIFSNLLKL